MNKDRRLLSLFLLCCLAWGTILPATVSAQSGEKSAPSDDSFVPRILRLLAPGEREAILKRLRKEWRDEYTVMVLEAILLSRDSSFNGRLVKLLEKKTGQSFGYDVEAWFQWLWQEEPRLHPLYPQYKAHLYALLDPKFRTYFLQAQDPPPRIRLDEVRWGGVTQDGIPPLRSPPMVPAEKASYLAPGDIVFGVEINGDVRAYPKRILAWHEMVTDTVGGVPMTGVYCTLCNSMIIYDDRTGAQQHAFGTSGFLYRSNKLMYDRATQSLWSTLEGEPVIGPLAAENIVLKRLSVVTTTWGEWSKRHPDSQVLALETGYDRDYSEGAAYRDYFADDELMFGVPKLDRRLRNKDEIVGLVLPRSEELPLALSVRFLAANPVYHDRVGETTFVALTDASGASRIYESGGVVFKEWDGENQVVDSDGTAWTLTESELRNADGQSLPRMAQHRAFWFGWFAAFPQTRLVDTESP